MTPVRLSLLSCALAVLAWSPVVADDGALVLKDNLAVLKAEAPNETYRFTGSNAPGQLFLPNEKATVRFDFAKGSDSGTVEWQLELQEITTRDPDARAKDGWTDTSGNAPLIGLEGQPLRVPLKVTFGDQPRTQVEVKDLPLPAKFGTYAVILIKADGKRQFLASLARLPQPRADGNASNVPIFGESVLIGEEGQRTEYYARMGIRAWRSEIGWHENQDGSNDWSKLDKRMAEAKRNGCQVMLTLGGHTDWTRPFNVPTPAANWTEKSAGYSGTGDWVCKPELYPRFGAWVETLVKRYWEGGKGSLWGLENYNEPWEGGGISGWASDIPRYLALQKLIYTSAKKIDPGVRILASSSIMNTEDKLYGDGSKEMDQYIDIFTDHYVPPATCYGPMVAKAHGKSSIETETWFVNTEYGLPQGAVQFLASGQSVLSPWHPRVLFDRLPGTDDQYFIPTPVVVATAAFNFLVTGKPFEKMVFHEHLPYTFQFGKDDDKDGVVVALGRLVPIGNNSYKVLPWAQVNATTGGTMTVDNADGLLEFYDLAANREFVGQKSVTLPLSFLPTYIKSAKGPKAVAERLKTAKIEGKRPVEIIPRDFATLPTAKGAVLRVEVRNRLNRAITGTLQAAAPAGVELKESKQPVALAAGELKTVLFPLAKVERSAANAYPFSFVFASDAGKAEYAETINAAIAPKGAKQIDGNLDDWKDVPGVTVIGKIDNVDITEQLRRPWLDVQKDNPGATSGEFKLAWDDQFVYVAARVNDPTPEENAFRFSERDENSYFHSAASDGIEPYKSFIEEFRKKVNDPKRSFAEVPYVYCRAPEAGVPFRRDRIQFGFDVKPGYHDMQPASDVPYGFHAVPDTDYEYSLYWVNDGKNGSAELWRHLAPGVPRIHDWPHQPRGKLTTGAVAEAKIVVRRDGNVYVYEAAIPRSELAEFPLKAGTDFGMALTIGNSNGGNAAYGADKATTKYNGLTLHPYWETKPSAGTRWTLVE